MADDDLRDRLSQWAAEPTPDLDGAFANRLETDLRLQAAERSQDRPGFLQVFLRPAVIAGAAVVVLLAVVLVRRDDDPANVFVSAADGASVSIPGSPTTTPAVAGLDLPDGSRILVGPNGSAVVAGVVLESGMSAVIVDGELELFDVPPDTDAPSTTVPVTDGPDPTDEPATTRPVETDAPVRPTDAAPTTRPPTTAPTTTAPATTAAPSTLPPQTAPDTTTTTGADRTTTTAAPVDVGVDVKLSVGRVREGQTVLRWELSGTVDAVAGFEVRAISGDEVRRIAVIRESNARRLRVEVPGPRIRYKVIARDADGRVIGESTWVGLPSLDG